MPPSAAPVSPPKATDRHKPRRTISISPALYEQLAVLAARNNRPLLWEVRQVLQQHLKDNGLWPPPEQDQDEEVED